MSRRSASPAEDAIHDLLQTMSQNDHDERLTAAEAKHHKQMSVCVSRALENAAWTLDEFCKDDAARKVVWDEISDGAQRMLEQLIAAGKQRDSGATEPSDASSGLVFAPPSPYRGFAGSGGTAPVPGRLSPRSSGEVPTTQQSAPRPSHGPHGTLRKDAPRLAPPLTRLAPQSHQLAEDPIEDSDDAASPRPPPSQRSVIEIDDDDDPAAEHAREWSEDEAPPAPPAEEEEDEWDDEIPAPAADDEAPVEPMADEAEAPAEEDTPMADDDEEEDAPSLRVGDTVIDSKTGETGQITGRTGGWWKVQIPSSDKLASRRSDQLTAKAGDDAEEEDAAPVPPPPKDAAPEEPQEQEEEEEEEEESPPLAARRPARGQAAAPEPEEDDAEEAPPEAEVLQAMPDEDEEEEEDSPPLAARRPARGRAPEPEAEAAPLPAPRARPKRGRAAEELAPEPVESEEEEEETEDSPPLAARRPARGRARDVAPAPAAKKPAAKKPAAKKSARKAPPPAKPAARAPRGKENAAPAPKKRAAAAPAAAPKRAKKEPGPAPRWGHSATVLEDGATMAVWGGDGDDSAVHLYRVDTGWDAVEAEDAPESRAWHAATASASRLVVFGGDAGDGRPVREGTAKVFDVDAGAWTSVDVAARPQTRLGHVLLALRDAAGGECVAALGGLRGRNEPVATTCDTLGAPFGAKKRLTIKNDKKGDVTKGDAPKPHAHGCAVVLKNGAQALVWTGQPLARDDTRSNKVFTLARDASDAWTWERQRYVMGEDKPSFRNKSACCLLPDGVSVLIHGGLDADSGEVLGDAHILDTNLWTWERAPKRVESAFGARAGHSLVCAEDGDTRMLLAFGGRGADGSELANLAKVVVDERTFKQRAVPRASVAGESAVF